MSQSVSAEFELVALWAERIRASMIVQAHRPPARGPDGKPVTLGALERVTGHGPGLGDSPAKPLDSVVRLALVLRHELGRLSCVGQLSSHRLVTRSYLRPFGLDFSTDHELMLEAVRAEGEGLAVRVRASMEHRHGRTLTLPNI
jgi:hypothetical protein